MNNETNINPNVDAEQMTGPVTTEQVPVVPEQMIEEAPVAPAAPEMVAEVPADPAVPEVVAETPAVPEMVAEAPAAPEMAPAVPEVVAETPAAAPEVVAETPAVPEMVAEAPAVPEIAPAVPEMVAETPAAVPEVQAVAPAVPEVVPEQQQVAPAIPEAVPAAPVVPAAAAPVEVVTEQPAAPAVDIPMSNVNMPTIETQPPAEVASNNFADFPMPEEPATTPVVAEAVPATQPVVEEGVIGETKKGNKTIYIILGVIVAIIAIVGIGGFLLTKSNSGNNNNTPSTPVEDTPKDITCSYDTVIRTIDVHSEAVIKVDGDSVSRINYTHTYSASDQSALNDKHLAAIEYCATPGAETKLGKDTKCELKDGKIIITAYLEGEKEKPVEDYKTALVTQGFVCN